MSKLFISLLIVITIVTAQDYENWNIYRGPFDDFMIDAIAVDTNDFKWIGANGYNNYGVLYTFKDSIWTHIDSANAFIPQCEINAIKVDSKNNKWIATDLGLYKFDNTTWTKYDTSNSDLYNNWVDAIAIDSADNVWVCSHILQKFDDSLWTDYVEPNTPNTTAIFIDSKGNVWVGTSFIGLYKYDGNDWTVYDETNSGLPDAPVYAITEDKNDNIWIGTREGLVKYDGSQWVLYDTSNSGLPDDNITDIAIDSSGHPWIQVFTEGLVKYDGTAWYVFTKASAGTSLDGSSLIAIDRNDHKWIGSFETLFEYKGDGTVSIHNSQKPKKDVSPVTVSIKKSSLHIQFNAPGYKNVRIIISSLDCKRLYSTERSCAEGINKQTISLNSYASGMYLCTVITGKTARAVRFLYVR